MFVIGLVFLKDEMGVKGSEGKGTDRSGGEVKIQGAPPLF